MQGGRLAFAKFSVVGSSRGAHRAYVNSTLRFPKHNKLAEGNVVQAEIIARAHGILVQNGYRCSSGIAAIPKLIELLPSVRSRWCRKNLTNLVAVDAELCGKGIGLIGLYRNLLCPDIRPWTSGAIDHHEVA